MKQLLNKLTGKEELEKKIMELQNELDDQIIHGYVTIQMDLMKMKQADSLTQELKNHIDKELEFHEKRIREANSENIRYAYKFGEQMLSNLKIYILNDFLKGNKINEELVVVDEEKDIQYIAGHTGIDKDTIEKILNAHYDYLKTLGLMD